MMRDKAGREVTVGTTARYYASGKQAWLVGTVRAVRKAWFKGSDFFAVVDDGQPNNNDMHTNGFTVAAAVESHEIEVMDGV